MSLDRESALEVVRERVDVRFSVSASDFADRLLTLPALITPAGDNPALPRRAGGISALRALALDDLYLATCCAAGDEGAWREFESKHFSFMRDFARRLLSATAADDLAAQVIADLWQRRKIAQYEGRSTLRTWLCAVVMRAALNARMGPAGQEARLARSEGDARGGRPDRHAGDRSAEEDGRLLARLL